MLTRKQNVKDLIRQSTKIIKHTKDTTHDRCKKLDNRGKEKYEIVHYGNCSVGGFYVEILRIESRVQNRIMEIVAHLYIFKWYGKCNSEKPTV